MKKCRKLSVIDCIVLFVLVTLLFSAQSCTFQKRATQTSHLPQLAVSGSETWTIGDKKYDIESTYLIVFEDESVQYTINYLCYEDVGLENMTSERAKVIAYPIANYAYENQLYKSKHVKKAGGEELNVSLIGVAITDKRTIGKEGLAHVSKSSGYRTNFTIDEIKKLRIDGDTEAK